MEKPPTTQIRLKPVQSHPTNNNTMSVEDVVVHCIKHSGKIQWYTYSIN